LDLLPKFFVEYHSSPDDDDRVGEEKLAEQRKKERHRSEVAQTAREIGGRGRQCL
jgi:hypothetical protein